MEDALELLDLAVAAVAMMPVACVADDELRAGVFGVQRQIDRLKVLHAGLVHEADRRRLWAGGGHRDVADWLADTTKTSRGDAASRAKLGAALGASDALKHAAEKGEVNGGREKPTILLTIDARDFTGASNGDGRTAHGDRVPAHVARFIAEQALVQRVLVAGNQILNVGRAERYATDAQYKALVARDGGCRRPGCRIPAAWCDIDHLHPWEDGGATDVDNMVMWCRHHHTHKHSPGVQVLGGVDDLRLQLADGTIIHCPPKGEAVRRSTQRPRTQAAA